MDYLKNKEPPFSKMAEGKYKKKGNENEL